MRQCDESRKTPELGPCFCPECKQGAELDKKDAELTRLRAEVERLKQALRHRMEWLSMHEDKNNNIVTLRYTKETFDQILDSTRAALTPQQPATGKEGA